MLNVCPSCGDLDFEKAITEERGADGSAVAICTACGDDYRFPYRTLFSLTGAPGCGKSTVARHLSGELPTLVLESDCLVEFRLETEMEWTTYCGLWLRVAMLVHYADRQVLLAGSGIGNPLNVSGRTETRYFPAIDRCALVCEEDVLRERLRERAWLQDAPEKRGEFLEHNRWFREHGPEHGIHLVDTTDATVERTARSVREWVTDAVESE